MAKALYICYFGVSEPLVQTQVVPYLRELVKGGHELTLLTFEADDVDEMAVRESLKADGIEWQWLKYHKRPSVPATLFDIANGARFIRALHRKRHFDILHARAHIALLMARFANRFVRGKVIFDLRGLIADEYVDAGVWEYDSLVFKTIKKLERSGLKKAEGVVVLTERLREYLEQNYLRGGEPTEVIPCCVAVKSDLQAGPSHDKERFELIYAGSVVGLYMLEEMGRFFVALSRVKPQAFFRILTKSPTDVVRSAFDALGVPREQYTVGPVSPNDVARFLESARLAISFRKATFSQIGASPTKMAEYFAAGLPVVMNSGVGDMDDIVRKTGTGVIVDGFSDEEMSKAVDRAVRLASDDEIESRAKAAAREYFDLQTVGGPRYLRLYERVLSANQK
jgi:glycosyltransferase involved in cell wall biosynthesis